MPAYKSKPNALTIIPNAMHIGAESCYIRLFENGTIEIQGNVTVNGTLTANGISLTEHTHNGVQSGPSNTGLPQ